MVKVHAKEIFDNQFGVRNIKKEPIKPETPNYIQMQPPLERLTYDDFAQIGTPIPIAE